MHLHKVLESDGFHAMFYQRFWHMVGADVVRFVNNFLHGGLDPKTCNKTLVAQIRKVKNLTKMGEFRPISLCNVLYKIASKTLANGLKKILPEAVFETQSAFVPKRLITNNSLIALEMFHSMKKRVVSRRGSMELKLDMNKAYDRIEWPFREAMLIKKGFDRQWVSQVMKCVTCASFSFIIYGRPRGSVLPSKELYQDGSLLFSRATRDECLKIVEILNSYEEASCQKVNFEKFEVSFSRGTGEFDGGDNGAETL